MAVAKGASLAAQAQAAQAHVEAQAAQMLQTQALEQSKAAAAAVAAAGSGPAMPVLATPAVQGTGATAIALAADPLEGLGVDWAARFTGAEIDHGYTSPGLGRDVVGCAVRAVAALVPRYRAYAGNVSHPPEVALAADHAPPIRCFYFGGKGTVAVRLLRATSPGHVAIEQPPSSSMVHPRAAPRSFKVYGWSTSEGAEPYSLLLGSFEYLIEGPRIQVFQLRAVPPGGLRGVQFAFGGNWGEDFTTACRLRVLGPAAA